MISTSIVLPMPPSANAYWRSAPGQGMYPTKEATAYKGQVASLCRMRGVPCVGGPYRIVIGAYGLRANADLGNVLKVLEDALELVMFENDKHAQEILLRRYSEDYATPYVVVEVTGNETLSNLELEVLRAKKADTNRKRKKTLKENRAAKKRPPHYRALARPASYRP